MTSLNREQLERYRIKVGFYKKFKTKKKRKAKAKKRTKKKVELQSEFKKRYYAYLKSDEWNTIKLDLYRERGKSCERCGVGKNIQVHHLTYVNVFREHPNDLVLLCGRCHKKEHGIK